MKIYDYNRLKAIEYAKKYSFTRNPKYFNFDKLGGNCTNFVSQCLYEGTKIMNYDKYGWYYNSISDRAPAWTGVKFLYNFLTTNKGEGPYAKIVAKQFVELGDVIFLLNENNSPFHSVIVTKIINGEILVASNTRDAYDKNLNDFYFSSLNFVHILGAKKAL